MDNDPVLDVLARIRPRPALYIGRPSAEALFLFLAGYGIAVADLVPGAAQGSRYHEFIDALYEKYGRGGGGHGWYQVLAWHAGSDEAALALFYAELDAFLEKPAGADIRESPDEAT